MLTAAFFGGLAASALLVGALLAYAFHPSPRITAAVMALGSGLLIGSVAYDLVADAELSLSVPAIAVSLLCFGLYEAAVLLVDVPATFLGDVIRLAVFLSVAVVLANFAADIVYGYLDPRVRR